MIYLSEPIGFVVTGKVHRRKTHVELYIRKIIFFEHFLSFVIKNIANGEQQSFIYMNDKSGTIIFPAVMRQESALDHRRRSPVEVLIGLPHNFEISRTDGWFDITPEFTEQKTKPEFRDWMPIPRHYQRTIGIEGKGHRCHRPSLPDKKLILATPFHIERFGYLGEAVDKSQIDFEGLLELKERCLLITELSAYSFLLMKDPGIVTHPGVARVHLIEQLDITLGSETPTDDWAVPIQGGPRTMAMQIERRRIGLPGHIVFILSLLRL